MRPTHRAFIGLLLGTVFMSWACSGRDETGAGRATETLVGPGSSVSARSDPDPVPLVSPSPSPSALPPAGSCPLGKGTAGAPCNRLALGQFYAQIDAVVAAVIQERPQLFDLTRHVGTGAYLVRAPEVFQEEVVRRLQATGLCAYYDFTRELLQVKDSDESSEDYALMLPNGHLRRGEGSYVSTCSPASFPLDPADMIDDIRVAFYAIECADGLPPPRNGEGKLRMECTGILTATPKKADNTDVDSRIHGPDIEWRLDQIDDYVKWSDFPGQPFNKFVTGLDPGKFRVCAKVLGIEGCLNGEVLGE